MSKLSKNDIDLHTRLENALRKKLHNEGIFLLKADEDRLISKETQTILEAVNSKKSCCIDQIFKREEPHLMSIYEEGLKNARKAKGLTP